MSLFICFKKENIGIFVFFRMKKELPLIITACVYIFGTIAFVIS